MVPEDPGVILEGGEIGGSGTWEVECLCHTYSVPGQWVLVGLMRVKEQCVALPTLGPCRDISKRRPLGRIFCNDLVSVGRAQRRRPA